MSPAINWRYLFCSPFPRTLTRIEFRYPLHAGAFCQVRVGGERDNPEQRRKCRVIGAGLNGPPGMRSIVPGVRPARLDMDN